MKEWADMTEAERQDMARDLDDDGLMIIARLYHHPFPQPGVIEMQTERRPYLLAEMNRRGFPKSVIDKVIAG